MERFSASLLNGVIRFGKYPNDEEVVLLKMNGYLVFVDLCPANEVTWVPYSKEGLYYNPVPIPDQSCDVGDLTLFRDFIQRLALVVQHGYKVYIHCRGGHGRSGMLAGILYGKLTKLPPETCLRDVRAAHQLRTEMKRQFRRLGSPQTAAQKRFLLSEV